MAEGSLDAVISLNTYYNYVSAWVFALQRVYGGGSSGLQACRNRQAALETFKKLQGGGNYSHGLIAAFTRGKLTLRAVNALPIEQFPDLALTANLWLPVQAYYAVHGFGLAALLAMGHPMPNDHRSFRAAFSRSICRLLPDPLCGVCTGGPELTNFQFSGLNTSSEEVAAQNNLANPRYSDGDRFIGKSLSTTRHRFVEEVFTQTRRQNVKPGRVRRVLAADERSRLAQGLHPTSIADLLFRMRIRANYDDPEMYLAAFKDTKSAVSHYKTLAILCDYVAECLCGIIRRKIGTEAMSALETRFE